MNDPYQIIKTVAITEKSAADSGKLKYTFVVHSRANKHDVKRAVEQVFERQVAAVNVMNCKGKSRRTRFGVGRKPDWKKAIVTLKDDQESIDLF